MNFDEICARLRKASNELALQNADKKNRALLAVANTIQNARTEIFSANKIDLQNAKQNGISESLLERLALDEKKLDAIVQSVHAIISERDPIGEITNGWKKENGLQFREVRVPLGVVAIIYESRPNVTVDSFALSYKSGNALLLRGSHSALHSNKKIVGLIKRALSENGIADSVFLLESENHNDVDLILNAVGKIDVVVPRGGKNLIERVVKNARIPFIETGSGVCHLFVDESADVKMATRIAENAKCQRPGACNAIECILVHKKIANEFLRALAKKFAGKVELRADEFCFAILQNANEKNLQLKHATENDFGFEFLDFICAVHAVDCIEEAIDFINAHNTKHSETIVTMHRNNARTFQANVDAACVYVNASTRFTDGGEFGFGCELGISTQKLHARGPMALRALTTKKFLIDGDGQIR